MVKSNLLMYFLGRETIINATANIGIMGEVSLERDLNTLQIENIYVHPKFRGMGIAGKIALEHIRLKLAEGLEFDRVQVIMMKENIASQNGMKKIGFATSKEKKSENPGILALLPGDTKIMMEKQINID
jgi:ribosomal protein S18 acetylase RimI-like enzyme